MKTSIFLSLAALAARHVAASEHPLLQWDPATAKDCEFHEWNPSVGLDCTTWDYQSYCVVTQGRLDNDPPPTTTTSTTEVATTTTSTSTLPPSPTAWAERGCYGEDPKLPILEQNMSGAGGDASLTIGKCKNSCYRRAYPFAGVPEGNQCWCGSYVGGVWARNQSDCNIPCTGDKTTFCGGKGLLDIFQALENLVTVPVTVSGTPTVAGTSMMGTSTASSGGHEEHCHVLWFW
ncbi:hypothetical protein C8A00DRAFT_41115 [Chaetomidium leptoderma]|uniref:WSC domain-containing protein n=1 Tax=Chaetomidium leptoderma TaxID=669021 RepID=A0AAN6VUG4_9PEZI|nr:hypothetical protein C8A00DRAFT_41115 [Chaetomidium leptoderma]